MNVKLKPLSFEHHGQLKLKKGPHLDAIFKSNNVDIAIHEFAKVACEAPIIFIKDQDSGQFRVVAVTGLKVGENLFVHQGKWQANFIPHCIGNTPFYLGHSQDSADIDDAVLLVDEKNGALGKEGTALFNDDGEYSDYVSATKESLKDYVKFQHMTKQFINFIVEHELLVSREIDITAGEESVSLHGIYLIDQQKLDSLSDELFVKLRKLNFLPLIYTHLTSISQFSNLISNREK
ncbi:SapC family protein [Thalassotalea hakodatensis]|uniref:SapC family protein n=1 Tax=Thalassotalea hakodatensis TaxID=3030492 RepID=UPI00257436AE|nr:SapC family protein [Thalassotalea hakodatensis]